MKNILHKCPVAKVYICPEAKPEMGVLVQAHFTFESLKAYERAKLERPKMSFLKGIPVPFH